MAGEDAAGATCLNSQVAVDIELLVLTGAGMSAESGVPTFRDAQTGLWANYRPEDLATPEAFAADPELVWRWYDWRRGLIAASGPNAAHRFLATLETRCPVTVITQNVDGLHSLAVVGAGWIGRDPPANPHGPAE